MKSTPGTPTVTELRRAWVSLQEGDFRGPQPAKSWDPEGVEVTVVAGCMGSVGASTVALAMAAVAGATRIVECAGATASGLAGAGEAELGSDDSEWTAATRGEVLIERLCQVQRGPGSVPLPRKTHHPSMVLDLSWELGQTLVTPGWLRQFIQSHPPIVLVTCATIPGIRRLDRALELLGPGPIVAAVLGPEPKKWPSQVMGEMQKRSRGLFESGQIINIPVNQKLAINGLDSAALPLELLTSAEQIWAILGDIRASKSSQEIAIAKNLKTPALQPERIPS